MLLIESYDPVLLCCVTLESPKCYLTATLVLLCATVCQVVVKSLSVNVLLLTENRQQNAALLRSNQRSTLPQHTDNMYHYCCCPLRWYFSGAFVIVFTVPWECCCNLVVLLRCSDALFYSLIISVEVLVFSYWLLFLLIYFCMRCLPSGWWCFSVRCFLPLSFTYSSYNISCTEKSNLCFPCTLVLPWIHPCL